MKGKIPPPTKRNHQVVKKDFFGPGEDLEAWQLGWDFDYKLEAKSSVSKKIFNYFIVECGFNMIFYYLDDGNFYGIHTEISPTPVFRFKKIEALYEDDKIGGQDTHDYYKGDILYWVDDQHNIWDIVKIDGKSLEEVIQHSYIVNIS